MTKLKCGTRRSLLAMAQSRWVARKIEELNPGVEVELVGMDTQGDKIQHLPLQKVEGKDFFVAELDRALIAKDVDFCVHSMKDLSLTRPQELIQAAVPVRENPRDVILFGPGALAKVKTATQDPVTFKIGTSSPRRLYNLPAFLESALPRTRAQTGSGNRIQLEWSEIRGNVNTRLARVHESPGSDRYLDGVVLAFAGLIRLFRDDQARVELTQLLKGVQWMILPLEQCPAAPAQGALSIECRREDLATQEVLKKLHLNSVVDQVKMEREVLAQFGGGCHQKLGATSIVHDELGQVFYTRGKTPQGSEISSVRVKGAPSPSQGTPNCWDGSLHKGRQVPHLLSGQDRNLIGQSPAFFIAHSRAINGVQDAAFSEKRIWASGVQSWFKLAEKGIWVEGCAEGLGFDFLRPTLEEPVLGLPKLNEWCVFSHLGARSEWDELGMGFVGTYEVRYPELEERELKPFRAAQSFFWTSGSQYKFYQKYLPSSENAAVIHSCGPGKTAKLLRSLGRDPQVFLTARMWREWIGAQND